MPAQRHRPPVRIATVSRSTLAQAHLKEIDAILRDLRLCSRRLRSALDRFTDELRMLERLYYKCKNQHRMALFFKRVLEIRRYARRLCELDIPERVDLLRASFVGLEHTSDQSQKALRGSWNHVPEKPYVCFLEERSTACSTLVCKMRERLENAYRHFMLAMQSGAFVQLILLFVAISSRMSMLSSELEDALQLCSSTCSRLLAIVDPNGPHAAILQQVPSEPDPSLLLHIDHEVPSEDMGQTVSRAEPADTGMMQITPPPSHPVNTNDHAPPALEKTAVTATAKPRPKKARKLDEIDEIFGF